MSPAVSLIAAVARDGGLGHRGGLLFRLPDDLKRFKALTMGHPVVMGRRTWDSIGRPLPGRDNLVLTRDASWQAAGARRVASWPEALAAGASAERVYVIGGAEVYALALPDADTLELTEVDAVRPADVHFPPWNRGAFDEVAREPREAGDGLRYAFVTLRRRPGAPAVAASSP